MRPVVILTLGLGLGVNTVVVRRLDPGLAVAELEPLPRYVERHRGERRFTMNLFCNAPLGYDGCMDAEARLPPTTDSLLDDGARPYFLWWTDCTVGEFKALLRSPRVEERAYWLGALLREANTRDVWLFATESEVRSSWNHLLRHLGRSRDMWAWLLGLPRPTWPPPEARRA